MNAERTMTDNKKTRLAEFGTGHRLAGLLALAVVALFGTVQWMQVGHEQAGEVTPNGERAASTTTPVDYYPAQVMN